MTEKTLDEQIKDLEDQAAKASDEALRLRMLRGDTEAFAMLRPIHHWFGLGRNAYVVIPRKILEFQPRQWQQRLVDLFIEIPDETLQGSEVHGYNVTAYDKNEQEINDPMADYRHGGKSEGS